MWREPDITHYKELVTNSEDKLRWAVERLSDATHKVAEAEKAVEEARGEVNQHEALLEYKLIEFEKKAKRESSSYAIKPESSSSLKETPLYTIGSPVYVTRSNGTESIAVVKNYNANSKLYNLELDGFDPKHIKRSLANNMRSISPAEYEAIQSEAEELRNRDDDERRKEELEYQARLMGSVGIGAPFTSYRSKLGHDSAAKKDAQRRIERSLFRVSSHHETKGGRNTKKYRRHKKRKTKHYKKKTKRYTKKRNMRY